LRTNSAGSVQCGMGAFFMGVAQEKAQAFNGRKIDGQFQFDRDKTVYVNHYYFCIDDENFGPLFIKVCPATLHGASSSV
jgi:hypothetical protein